MNDQFDLDARLSRFLVDEAPARAPERLVDATRRGVAGTAQRGRAGMLGRRLWSALLTPAGAVAAAVLVVAVGAVLVSASRSGSSSGAEPTSPAPSLSPRACPSGQGTCLGLLQPGTYSSSSFLPVLNYTVAGGWANTLDVRGQLDLAYATGGQYTYPDGLVFRDGISIFRQPVAESPSAAEALPGIGKTANDLAQWLVGHDDLDATTPTPVTIGNASGYRLTIGVPTGPRESPDKCVTDHGEPRCVTLFISDDLQATYGFGLVGPETAVVYLLDTPTGDTVMVVIDDVDGVDQPRLEAAALPIVNSLTFATP